MTASPKNSPWFVRREVPLPTPRTFLLGLLFLLGSAWAGVHFLYPFLAVEERFFPNETEADIICVEGWAHDEVIEKAVSALQEGVASRIAVTGGPVQSREQLLGFESYAELGAHRLEERGISPERIVVSVPGPAERRRTLHDILELQRTLESAGLEPKRIQVFSGDVHTRRTGMLYSRIFGPEVEVRSCSVAPETYDPARWWSTSEGLKTVVMEGISWGYEALCPARS